jgi:exonuclease SbcC
MLIYGRNESGKSTVMEAIHYSLYGLALRPSKNASNDDLINYGYPQAVVELVFTIDDHEYSVKRIIKRRGANSHELVIQRSSGERERVTGARPVNDHILEELHGIDSDALLNSCLVEQKELGKLEASVRAKRIEAMTSLLNIETFVDAQVDLKQSTRELELNNQETVFRLEKAEQAKIDYEKAEEKLGKAQDRIDEIFNELEAAEKKIAELKKILKVIDQVKEINGAIEKKAVQADGLRRELKRIEESLKEAKEAVELVEQIEEELPEACLSFQDAETLYKALEKLLGLEHKLENARREVKRSKERLEEADNKLEESKQASEQVRTLNDKIIENKQARYAQSLLPSIEALSGNIISARAEIKRLKQDESELGSKLESLMEAARQIEQLSEEENQLESSKREASQRRNMGIISLLLGFISLLGLSYSQYLLPLGVVLIITGAIIAVNNSPSSYDPKLLKIRGKREALLGDKSRIEEYQQDLEDTKHQLNANEKKLTETETVLKSTISKLPSTPREYQDIIQGGNELKSSNAYLRELIHEDLQTLAKLTTERDLKKKLSDELEQRNADRKKQSNILEERQSNIGTLQLQIHDLVEKHDISSNQALSIRTERDESQKRVQELETNLDLYKKKASQREKLASEFKQVQDSIENIEKNKGILEEERNQLLTDNKVDLDKEADLRTLNEALEKGSASLETEKSERIADVEEAQKVIDDTSELKDEYPKLVAKNEEEGFELEAMRRAVILLDTTRDGIMGGVKKRIESHMAQFLPTLTDQRYNMARIDEKDYRIEIYDREAKRWRGKGVFSGATQDQFSLALRLAFALSTIPSTRGARPGFIFLDEPLSGFDTQRRQGFMHLLQEELPKYFDQIIVISHLEQLRDEFPHHIQLEAGQIIN